MKAITVQQPWAWAIIHGGKDVENRTWLTHYRGPLLIQAGKRISDRGMESELIGHALRDRGHTITPGIPNELTGVPIHQCAIIGMVDLVDAHHYAGSGPDAVDCCESPWAEERYDEHSGRTRLDIVHLALENPRPIGPIPCNGQLGLWTPTPHTLRAVGEAIDQRVNDILKALNT